MGLFWQDHFQENLKYPILPSLYVAQNSVLHLRRLHITHELSGSVCLCP